MAPVPAHPFDIETVIRRGSPRERTRVGMRLRWKDAAGDHEAIVSTRCVLGSAERAEIVVADPAVSRIHLELEPRDDGLWVRDLGSKNGASVNGVEVGLARLPQGSRLRVGDTTLHAEGETSPAAVDLWPADSFGPLVGPSAAMREMFVRLVRVAQSESTVLVRGETGTGKDLVARAIHDASPRAGHPFVVVDCAAMTESLLESELFGHAKGAFTGANAAREGAIEAANKGTVFIDEVGELPLSMQPKLLRVLETRSVRRVGETHYRPVDVRFVCATHRDLQTMVNAGAFREDVYFRLSVLPLTIPPLRDRVEDIGPLAQHFLQNVSRELGVVGAPAILTSELLDELERRPWLGNVRELRNFTERLVTLGAREALSLTGASTKGDPFAASTSLDPPATRALVEALGRPLKEARDVWVDTLERDYVGRLLERCGRNVPVAAERAGVNRTYMYRLIRKHGL